MKAKNLNRASQKTREAIKRQFAQMLAEEREIGKISVSELCRRADISRGAFYSHYDDIWGVAEDYENELIDTFFDNARLHGSSDQSVFIDTIFDYIRKNDDTYRMLCRSNDFLFTAKRLTAIASSKLLELCLADPRLADRTDVALDIRIFVNGLFWEYVKYCRNISDATLDDLYRYTRAWGARFWKSRASAAPQSTVVGGAANA